MFYIPKELTDPRIRGQLRLEHGERYLFEDLLNQLRLLKEDLARRQPELVAQPGFEFDSDELVKARDGTPRPSYDVLIGYSYERSPAELEQQRLDREAYIAHKQADFKRREAEQRAIFESIVQDMADAASHFPES